MSALSDALGALGQGFSGGVGAFYDAQEADRVRALQAQELKRQRAAQERATKEAQFKDLTGMLDRAAHVNPGLAQQIAPQVTSLSDALYGTSLSGTGDKYGLGSYLAPKVQKTMGGEGNPAGLNYSPIQWKDGGAVPTSTVPDAAGLKSLSALFTTPLAPKIEDNLDPYKTQIIRDPYTGASTTLEAQPKPDTSSTIKSAGGGLFDTATNQWVVAPPQQIVVGANGQYYGVNKYDPTQTTGTGVTSGNYQQGAERLRQQKDVVQKARELAKLKDVTKQAEGIEALVLRRRTAAMATAAKAGMPVDEATLNADDSAYRSRLQDAIAAASGLDGTAKPAPGPSPAAKSAKVQDAMSRMFGSEYVAAYQQFPEVKAYEDYIKRREAGQTRPGEGSPVSMGRIKAIREAIRSGGKPAPVPAPSAAPSADLRSKSWSQGLSPDVQDILASVGINA